MVKLINFAIVILIFSISESIAQLRKSAEKHNKYIGAAINPDRFNNYQYTTVLDREFDSITPDNVMKWDTIESSRGHFNFAKGDIVASHGHKANQKIRGHTLVWHAQLPHWVTETHDATELKNIMETHIKAEAGHYKEKLYAWDVVNEPFEEDGRFRNSIFFQKLGKEYIATALRAAHAADPHAKLYINDYNIEGINQKSTAMYNLIKELKAKNVPIHGVGFQAHFTVGQLPHDLEKNMERFAALGIDIAITELDIRIKMPVDSNKLHQQANDYATVARACRAVSRCVGITLWGVYDKDSWIPQVSHGYGSALILDENFKEKPAYGALRDAFN